MDMFSSSTINLGGIGENESTVFTFAYTGKNLKSIVKSVVACCPGCTKVLGISDDGIRVKYLGTRIPYHIKSNRFEVNKCIKVNFTDGSVKTLNFKVLIIRD